MSNRVLQYRFRCVTEDCDVFVWKEEGQPTPTACPNDTPGETAHTIDLSGLVIVDELSEDDVNIKSSEADLITLQKGFRDLSGHNLYRFGELLYDIKAGEVNLFMEKFTNYMYIGGGGVTVPKSLYVSGEEVIYRPEKGDWCAFDIVDIDAVTPYGIHATITNVSRNNDIVTLTTDGNHGLSAGMTVCINVNDDTFDDMEETIISIPTLNTLTYANTGVDVSEKAATGDVGLIVVLASFVPKCYVRPEMSWICEEDDAKIIPPGIYLRFRYVSAGSTDLVVMPYYSMRTA